MSLLWALLNAVLLSGIAVAMPGAMPWMGPMPTPLGLIATVGMSPLPTEAPGANGIPKELRKRQSDVQFPPPDNWCGFIDSDYNDPLSCSADLTCIISDAVAGCCTATTGACTALWTTCADHGESCNSVCQKNPAILKCPEQEPYCGTYSFPGETFLYNCQLTAAQSYPVEFMNDFYSTAIGSTLGSGSDTDPFGYTDSVSLDAAASSTGSLQASATLTPTSADSFPTTTSTDNDDDDDFSTHHGISQAAIDGIAIAVSLVGFILFCIAGFCFVRIRRRRRMAAAQGTNTYIPPPMQQQDQQPPPPKAFDGYQSVPQNEQSPPYTQYPSPPPAPQTQTQTGYIPPPGAASAAISPQSTGLSANDPRLSTANAYPFSPQEDPNHGRQSYYKPPLSPAITEVEGSNTALGRDHPVTSPGGHSAISEVDGTMGNPGSPVSGYGDVHQHGLGRNPSATEVEGAARPSGMTSQGMGSNMHQPYSEGPFELGHTGQA